MYKSTNCTRWEYFNASSDNRLQIFIGIRIFVGTTNICSRFAHALPDFIFPELSGARDDVSEYAKHANNNSVSHGNDNNYL